MLQYVKGKAENWPNLTLYEKYNTLVWELVSHLWFLLVLVVLTTVSLVIFSRLRRHLSDQTDPSSPTLPLGKLSVLFLLLGCLCRRETHSVYRLSTDTERRVV
jgi:glucan biosynthesis protein C